MAKVLVAAGKDAQTGPTKAHRVAQWLALRDGDIRAVASRRCEKAEGNRVEDDDEQRASPVCQLSVAFYLFKVTGKIGLLHNQTGTSVGQDVEAGLQFGYGCILTATISFDDFAISGVHCR